MAMPMMSKRKAHILAILAFLVGLGILTYYHYIWPGMMLVTGIALGLRQYLLGRRYDMTVSLIVFLGAYITIQFNIYWEMVMPVLFTIGSIYILFREFFGPKDEDFIEKEEDVEKEIEEKEEK